MAMVVSEQKVTGSGLLLAEVLADPISLMASNFKDCIAVNKLLADGSFVLTYSDLDSSFYLSAAQSYWTQRLPKWKFASNTLDDDALQQDDQEDPLQVTELHMLFSYVDSHLKYDPCCFQSGGDDQQVFLVGCGSSQHGNH